MSHNDEISVGAAVAQKYLSSPLMTVMEVSECQSRALCVWLDKPNKKMQCWFSLKGLHTFEQHLEYIEINSRII